MILSDMLKLVNLYIDDVADTPDVVSLLNAAQNRMAAEARCKFPQLVASGNLNGTFVFDEKYHEIPILYAAAMIKAQDSSIREKDSFLQQFNDGLRLFLETYDPPVQYRDDNYTQQFTATAGQTGFTVTKNEFDPLYGNLRVYVNGKKAAFNKSDSTFMLLTPAAVDDLVTAEWDIDSNLSNKPAYYSGW